MKRTKIQLIILGGLVVLLLITKLLFQNYFSEEKNLTSPITDIQRSDFNSLPAEGNNVTYRILEKAKGTSTTMIRNEPLFFNRKVILNPDSEYLIGTGKETFAVVGHYQEYTVQYFPFEPSAGMPPRVVTCKGLLITGGDQGFIAAYNSRIPKIAGKTMLNLDYMGLENRPDYLKSIYGIIRDGENIQLNVKADLLPDRQVIPCDNYGITIAYHEDTRPILQLKGYYSPFDRVMTPMDYDPVRDPKPQTVTCPAFTITDGDVSLISKYNDQLYHTNPKNTTGGVKNLVLNINIDDLSPLQNKMLIQSDPQSPVTLAIKERPPAGSGCEMNCCRGFADIVSIQK